MRPRHLAAVAVAMLAVPVLTGCSATATEAEPADTPKAPAAVPLSDQKVSPSAISPQGHVILEAGDVARLEGSSGAALATFRVLSVEVDPTCTRAGATPANGSFVELKLELETTAALGAAETTTLDFTAPSWSATAADGIVLEDVVGASDTCMGPASKLTPDTGAEQARRGGVVLDVPAGSGVLTLDLGGAAPWDIAY